MREAAGEIRDPAEHQDGPEHGHRNSPARMGARTGLELLAGQARQGPRRDPGEIRGGKP